MKKLIALILALVFVFALTACGAKPVEEPSQTQENTQEIKITDAKSLADLKGMRISAQQGTFHETALDQIENVQKTSYPDFPALLVALKANAIDGYIAEEPTALAETLKDDTLTYVPLKNNDTGFTAGKEDTGIAIGLKTDSELREKINAVLAEIPEETKKQLMEEVVKLSAGEDIKEFCLKSEEPENPTGTLKVAMECAYQPFNWTDLDGAATVGAVPIMSEGYEGKMANGYDVQVAKYVANKLGLKLEVYALVWDALIPALNSGTVDAIVAGMSPTAEREKEIDFTDTYYESDLVVVINK